ncbi:MAG: polysaccharide deacetylase family protein [bacterium]|nr:polysaccharide deacetylase family protein [bacterium]
MKGIFVISIDVEFGWGLVDVWDKVGEYESIRKEREAIRRVLEIFKGHGIRATWAIVGHLFREVIEMREGRVVPEIPRPIMVGEKNDWFAAVGEGGEELWCARDVVRMIREAEPQQEIGSHSFGHLRYEEGVAHEEAIRADIELARKVHEGEGVSFRVFVFPYNHVGFRRLLAEAGVRAYRGQTRRWYDGVKPYLLWRGLNLLTQLMGSTPPVVTPVRDEYGMVNVPDSMLLYHRRGLRRLITPRRQVEMAVRGMEAAAREGKIFHLWFHPSNIEYRMEEQCRTLDEILCHARRMIDDGVLENMTIGEVARTINNEEVVNGCARASN